MLRRTLLSLSLLHVCACSHNGDDGAADASGGSVDASAVTADAAAVDGAASADASAPVDGGAVDAAGPNDGTPPGDDGRPGDGGSPMDAGPAGDGGSAIGAICDGLCAAIFACAGVPPDPACAIECSADLGDCSDMELAKLGACVDVDCTELESCVLENACVGGGGEGGCGDDVCDESAGEDCGTCPDDCGDCVCGDGTCASGECATCASDCPAGCSCPHDVCEPGALLDAGCSECAGMVCALDSFCCDTEWDPACVGEVERICGKDCPAICGDSSCDDGETCETCADCCLPADPPPPMP